MSGAVRRPLAVLPCSCLPAALSGLMRPAAGIGVSGEPLQQRFPALLAGRVHSRFSARRHALWQSSKYTRLTRSRPASTRAHCIALHWQLIYPFEAIKRRSARVKSPYDPVCVCSLPIDLSLQAEINLELFGPRRVTRGASTLLTSELVVGRELMAPSDVRWSYRLKVSNWSSGQICSVNTKKKQNRILCNKIRTFNKGCDY